MRTSCNGCRVLRRKCTEGCSIRPCLDWMKSPESQENATVFLTKFYSVRGLIKLIDAGPVYARPEIFKSLLYEACGRIVNPVHGSMGLLSSENWQLCQAAVEAVLKGKPITEIATDAVANGQSPPLKISKNENYGDAATVDTSSNGLKRAKTHRTNRVFAAIVANRAESEGKSGGGEATHESSLSHESEIVAAHEGKITLEQRDEILKEYEEGKMSANKMQEETRCESNVFESFIKMLEP